MEPINEHPSDNNLQVKTVLKASFVRLIESDKEGFSSMAADQGFLAVARLNAKINIYELTDKDVGKLLFTILGHSNPVFTMLIHNELLFTGESIEDALIKIWELRTGTLVRALKGHTQSITNIAAYSRDLIASGSCDCSVRVWQLEAVEEAVTRLEHDYPVLAVVFLSEEVLASGGDDCFLIIWRWQTKQKLHTLLAHDGSLNFILRNRTELITGGGDGHIKLFNTSDLTKQVIGAEDKVSVEVSPNALQHATCFEDIILVSDLDSQLYIIKLSERGHTKVSIQHSYFERRMGLRLISQDLFLTVDSKVKLWRLEASYSRSNSTNLNSEIIIQEI